MGAVWEAENLLTERLFAVKVVSTAAAENPEVRARMMREARASGRVVHRNVVELYDVGEQDGSPFLVMQLLTGESLEARLEREGPMPAAVVALIVSDIARGLGAAHAAGVVHRDLKPANVFLHQDPDLGTVVKVVDFGVSKVLGGSDTATMTGMAIGSPAYMAPEQARGDRGIDHRTDLWALGVVAFELCAGTRPFRGDSPYDVVAEILKGDIPRLADVVPGVDPALDTLVASCLVRDRDRRLSTTTQVLQLLEPLVRAAGSGSLAGAPERSPGGGPLPSAPTPTRHSEEGATVRYVAPTPGGATTMSPATQSGRRLATTGGGAGLIGTRVLAGGALIVGVAVVLVVAALTLLRTPDSSGGVDVRAGADSGAPDGRAGDPSTGVGGAAGAGGAVGADGGATEAAGGANVGGAAAAEGQGGRPSGKKPPGPKPSPAKPVAAPRACEPFCPIVPKR